MFFVTPSTHVYDFTFQDLTSVGVIGYVLLGTEFKLFISLSLRCGGCQPIQTLLRPEHWTGTPVPWNHGYPSDFVRKTRVPAGGSESESPTLAGTRSSAGTRGAKP